MRSKILRWSAVCAATVSLLGVSASAQPKATYTVDPTTVVQKVDSRIYGQFLEHIFNSVHGGLWGDMILNGGFVNSSGGGWDVKDDMIYLTAPAMDQRVLFGEPTMYDYELTLDARKDSDGGEGFIVIFRATTDRFYWMNFGGWGNSEHGLEKNGAPVKRVPGKIQTGKWYKVKIRCEGPHIQAWLDDQPIIDLKDDNPLPFGQIGINTWGNKASFRNIKVTSLHGETLLDRLPTRDEISSVPAYWQMYKLSGLSSIDSTAGYATFDNDDSLSGNGSTVLNGIYPDHICALEQPISIVKGETYKGRIYLRSPDLANVELVIEPGYSLNLNKVSNEWKAYDFEFTAKDSSPEAKIRVGVRGKGTLKVSNFTLFPKSASDCGGFRPDLLKAIKDIKPATIRYPGGCFASAYNWKDAIGPREKRKYYPNTIWGDRDPNQMGTDEFMLLCEKVGAEPILAINKGRGVQDALDWMEYCNGPTTSKWGKLRAENGHLKPYNVRYWEIDNEVWGMQPEDYAKEVKLFSQAIKSKDPKAIIIACGSYAYDTGVGEGGKENWNKRLLDNAAEYFDYLSIHYYNGICVDQDCVQDPLKYETFIHDSIGKLIKDSKNPNIKVYCSEWGMMNSEWRSGLYTAGILNGFERISDVCPMTCPAVWLQRISADKPNPRWASSQILYDNKTFVPAPEYVVEKLWRDNFGPNLVKMDGSREPLNTVATTSKDGKTLYFKMVNPTKDAVDVELNLSKGKAGSVRMSLVNPGDEKAKNILTDTNKVKVEAGKATLNGNTVTCSMPALSAGVLEVKLK